jgi:UDP-N-acetylglucosamine--N-acetylmuramyl-(pentapeptide) pyrophosphoryl-undecaprenol N-acetylglucosamine transferase
MSTPFAQTQPVRLMLTGGGTGGHLFPAVATAENLSSRVVGSEILFVGTKRKLDRSYLEQFGFSVKTIHSYGLKGKKIPALIKALAVLPVSFCEACYHIIRFRPHVVCGVGGYVTGPVVAAAWLLRKPTVIHEQNSVPGLANRKLGPLVTRICISLPQSEKYFPPGKTVLTGNPVRKKILEVAQAAKSHPDKMTIVVLGGSQGAHAINKLMVDVLTSGDEAFAGLQVIHQTGRNDEEMVSKAYQDSGIEAKVAPFFTDMGSVYDQADLVVSRAGATTLAEIAVLGKPAILIPYPFAADDHQQKNGAWYVDSGAAVLLSEKELTPEILGTALKEIIMSPEKRRKMSVAMRKLSMPDAADKIVDICLTLVGKS